ncbi:MAG: bifunctional (p)ppGpp synthetase/guanosine-3',5'-bis(diphosphate) 3'-pyrophosphohydrolase [Candidatus Colwellbacteria bacterium]|nr:bifunctional (p)ppGpp synthetase/guanosine-3',5'-bis(diphosphate) 3'-pyrophosphohydrolase [Candidatus Colwellbacteria bacterium]
MATLEGLKNKSDLVRRALKLADKISAETKRPSGSSYLKHYTAVAEQLAAWDMDEATVAAGLLHDITEDTSVTLQDIELEFGEEVKNLVEGVTKLGRIKSNGSNMQAETLRKMIIAMAKDLRVIFIKLVSRLDNMKTLGKLSQEQKQIHAKETMEVYAPLAQRLGIQRLAGELEDLSFPHLYPEEHKWLLENVQDRYEEREKYLSEIKPLVIRTLRKVGIKNANIDFRAKRYASLYKKLLRYDMDIDKIYDLVAFRIIVNDTKECYEALGAIHNLWHPMPGRIKDYIASPKANGYQSIHTTVIGPDLKAIEFQIRTRDMHKRVENGAAAQWAYEQIKGSKKYIKRRAESVAPSEIAWVEKLRAWQKEYQNPQEFLDALKIDFFKDRIFVLTPKGEVIDLPQGATLIDFAYAIHSDIGNQCVGAKVNGKIVPLDYKLKSQDIVEIITRKNKKPSTSWLDFVVTANAKSQIKKAIRRKNDSLIVSRMQTELKMTIEDRIGLLKDISSVISRSHINITGITSSQMGGGKYQALKIKCSTADKDKVWKLILKLKKIKEIKEIDYRFV